MNTVEFVIVACAALVVVTLVTSWSHRRWSTRTVRGAWRVPSAVAVVAATMLVTAGGSVNAVIVPTIGLGTSANYSVLAGSTVTNTGPSVLGQSAGVSPGSAVVGFPPGQVLGVIDAANGPAAQAQLDLLGAYNIADNRPVNVTTTPDLSGLTLVGGVYSSSNAPLSLTGTLVLDGEGDPNSVFIFQTDSTLVTGSGSVVQLINGAQECNVFWQVGSSATLGTGSVFSGNILALTSITATTGATIHGRALARNGAVTLDTNVFTAPTCDLTAPTTTTTPAPATTVAPTVEGPTTIPGETIAAPVTTEGAGLPPIALGPTFPPGTTPGELPPIAFGPTFPASPTSELPSTGSTTVPMSVIAGLLAAVGVAAVLLARRRASDAG